MSHKRSVPFLAFMLLNAWLIPPAIGQIEQPEEPVTVEKSGSSDTWPQWRGPTRDGVSDASKPWPDSLDEESFKRLWDRPLGPSYSGPIVSPKLVFTTETRNSQQEVIRGLDRLTGEQKWEATWDGAMTVPFFAKANGDWIRSTPAYDGESLYIAGMRDVLVCLDASSGSEKWRVDFVAKFGTPLPSFGFVCSPLVDQEHVYVQAASGVCKLQKSTGEVLWRKVLDGGGMNGSAFSSPIMVEIAKTQQLLVQSRDQLMSLDPKSGDVQWSQPIPTFRGMNILTPTVYQDSVFTSAYGGKSLLFDISTDAGAVRAKQAWLNPATAYMSSPVVVKDCLYMHLRNQRFTCLDLKTGKTRWTTKPFGKYWSMVTNGDRILALDERGELLLIRANPEKFELVDSRKVSDESAWAHLAIAGDQVFIRKLNGLIAFRWRTPDTAPQRD